MPCGFRGCDYNVFCVDQKTSAHLQCVDLICFNCKHRRQISLENFELMVDMKRRVIYDKLYNNIEWDEESVRKAMMQYNITEDMK